MFFFALADNFVTEEDPGFADAEAGGSRLSDNSDVFVKAPALPLQVKPARVVQTFLADPSVAVAPSG